MRGLFCIARLIALAFPFWPVNSSPALAQSLWDGGTTGTGTMWMTSANWAGDSLPASGTNVVFNTVNGSGLMPGSMGVGGDFNFGQITFDNINGKFPTSLVIVTNPAGTTTARTLTLNTGISLLNANMTLTFNGSTNGSLAFALGGNVTFTAGSGGILAINPVISGSGRVTILGGGMVNLNGTNLFTGGVTVGGGAVQPTSTLVLGNTTALGAVPTIAFDTSLVIDNGYVRGSSAGSYTLPPTRGITITPNGATLAAYPGTNLTVNSVVKEASGPSRLTIGSANAGSGTVFLGASSNVSGGFSDGVTVQGGAVLSIGGSSVLGLAPAIYDSDNVLLNGGTLRVNSNGVVVLSATRGVTITPQGATLSSPSAAASLTVSSPILESGGSSRLTVSGGGTVAINGSSNGSGGFTGGITVTIPGTVLSVGTTAALGIAPASAVADNIVLNGGTSFAYGNSGGVISSVRGWQIGPTSGSDTATISLTRTTAGATLRIDGVIANQPGGTGGLNVTGAGNIMTLTGVNTYSGPTTLAGGVTLVVNSPASGTGTGSVLVNSGTTLAGSGVVASAEANAVTVAAGGMLAPGNLAGSSAASGTLTIQGTTTFAPDSILKIGVSELSNSSLTVNGTLTLDPAMKLKLDGTGWNPLPGQSYAFPVANATIVNGLSPGYVNRIAYDPATDAIGFSTIPADLVLYLGDGNLGDANTLYVSLTMAAVPEPAGLALIGAAGFAGSYLFRRRRTRHLSRCLFP